MSHNAASFLKDLLHFPAMHKSNILFNKIGRQMSLASLVLTNAFTILETCYSYIVG